MLLRWEHKRSGAGLEESFRAWLSAMLTWVSSPVHRTVISALIEARKAAGLTQRDLAGRLGKPRSWVAKIETIERNISVLEFLAWMHVVGADAGALVRSVSQGAKGVIEI